MPPVARPAISSWKKSLIPVVSTEAEHREAERRDLASCGQGPSTSLRYARADGAVLPLLLQLGERLGDDLLAVLDLAQEGDAVDLARVVPSRLDQDAGHLDGAHGHA